MKPTWYFSPTYRQNYYFFIAWKYQDFVKYMKKNYDYDQQENTQIPSGTCKEIFNDKGSIYLIWCELHPKTPFGISILSHECIHAAMFTLGLRGINVTTQDHEVLTYLHCEILEAALTRKLNSRKVYW